MGIRFSRHAREQMIARGITEKEVEEALRSGSKHLQAPDKIVSEYQYFSVVYKQMGPELYVITVKPRW